MKNDIELTESRLKDVNSKTYALEELKKQRFESSLKAIKEGNTFERGLIEDDK